MTTSPLSKEASIRRSLTGARASLTRSAPVGLVRMANRSRNGARREWTYRKPATANQLDGCSPEGVSAGTKATWSETATPVATAGMETGPGSMPCCLSAAK